MPKKSIFQRGMLSVCVFLYAGGSHAIPPFKAVWDEHNLEHFSNSSVLVLWRGVHFLKENFPDQASMQRLWDQDTRMPIYSAAVHQLSRIPMGTAPSNDRQRKMMENHVKSVQNQINNLTNLHQFHQVYSNFYDLFHKLLREKGNATYPYFSGLTFERNPFVSSSLSVPHAAFYSYGLKNFGRAATMLKPDYTASGRPKNPWLGIVYGLLINQDMADETKPYDVILHHKANHITVKTHYTCNILAEQEVSLVGRIPANCQVVKMPACVPSLVAYQSEYQEAYGLTERRFNNRKKVIAVNSKSQTALKAKQDATVDLIRGIISADSKDKAGIHEFTMSEKLTGDMERRLRNVGATVTKIDIDGNLN